MPNGHIIDSSERGREIAELLYTEYHIEGIFGNTWMPEDLLPADMEEGSIEHLLFITLTVAIDYMRDAVALWHAARLTFENYETRYLFYPAEVCDLPEETVREHLQLHDLAIRPQRDTKIWRTLCQTFHEQWDDNPNSLIRACNNNALQILNTLQHHPKQYPNLRGRKISRLLLRMLRDNLGIELQNLAQVRIPVDIHIARATLCTGVVHGQYEGPISALYDMIAEAWTQSVQGIVVDGREIIPLDLDEPLWHLSKYGCRQKSGIPNTCPYFEEDCLVQDYCIEGIVGIHNHLVELQT